MDEIFLRDWVMVAREEEIPDPGSFVQREVLGENVLLVRGRDEVIRAFYNVCRHRGTAVEERECGTAVRFQCPYHAWIYDLDGRLIRAKHTEDLEDFSFDTFGLVNLEAMEHAKPVVATAFGGAPEVVADGETGFVANPFDVPAYAGKIALLLRDDVLYTTESSI